MNITVPDSILHAANMSHKELSIEIAVMLFQKEKLSLALASRLAGMNRLQFQHLLSSRDIPIHYDVKDFEEDLETLKRLGRI